MPKKGTKHGQPFTYSHMFGGKRYSYLIYEDTKAKAKQRANLYRRNTSRGLARITKEVSPLGKVIYAVWVR